MKSLRYPKHLGLTALLLGLACERLLWQRLPGIGFPIFILLILLGGIWLTRREGNSTPASSLGLIAPLLGFATLSFLRDEPLAWFLNTALALFTLGLLAMSWLGGRWPHYSLPDHLWSWVKLVGAALFRPLVLFYPGIADGNNPSGAGVEARSEPLPVSTRPRLNRKVAGSLMLGLLLAFPVVLVLGALLAQADPVFARSLEDLLKFFDLETLRDLLGRLVFILFSAYGLAGAFAFALRDSRDEKLFGLEQPLPRAFLGWIEAATVLFSVDLLFAAFVGFQFRYFFGGETNINLDGFTYAEYARRGFGELVAVAALSLLLFLSLSAATRRDIPASRKVFSGLGIALLGLVAVMLVSAFQRLTLYEAAYGFTRLRTYTHVFMVWLGLLLAAMVVLELAGRLRYIALAAIVFALGFALTLSVLNVDGFIVRQNVTRAAYRGELDAAYLVWLSEDAVPALFASLQEDQLDSGLRSEIGGALACRKQLNPPEPAEDWRSWRLAPARAANLFQLHAADLERYRLRQVGNHWQVWTGDDWQACDLGDRFD